MFASIVHEQHIKLSKYCVEVTLEVIILECYRLSL